MRSNYIAGAVIVVVGATIGMTLTYFTLGSPGGGALFGGLVGLYFAVMPTQPVDSSASRIPSRPE